MRRVKSISLLSFTFLSTISNLKGFLIVLTSWPPDSGIMKIQPCAKTIAVVFVLYLVISLLTMYPVASIIHSYFILFVMLDFGNRIASNVDSVTGISNKI